MKNFNGKVLFLDRDDINTDEIIPAKYLTEVTREALKPYLLEDLTLEGFNTAEDLPGKSVIVTRSNFGCGSSREHAPWALEMNGINMVIAESFARIFRQNMYNCGLLAVELPGDTIDALFKTYSSGETSVEVDLDRSVLIFSSGDRTEEISYIISDYDAALIQAGGWIEYADTRY